jgi:uncharacterized protein (UPF0335 family)
VERSADAGSNRKQSHARSQYRIILERVERLKFEKLGKCVNKMKKNVSKIRKIGRKNALKFGKIER